MNNSKAWSVIALALLAIALLSSWRRSALASAVHSKPAPAHVPELPAEPRLSIGAAHTVSTYAERQRLGFQFGYVDGVMGSVPDEDNYLYFGSAKSADLSCQMVGNTPQTQGVYTLVPAPGNPLQIASARCTALLRPSAHKPGVITPSPIGPYDRDYLGGGPVMRISDGRLQGILIIYHAEFQFAKPQRQGGANLFFGTLGMAISTDNGKTFEKLGQIIQPHPSRPEWISKSRKTSLSVGDGPFVFGDDSGRPVDPRNPDPEKTFIYVYYIDYESDQCGGQQCLAVARAPLADVIAAAFNHADKKPVFNLFQKYYKGTFKEPAATGNPNNAEPSGLYSPVLKSGYSPSIIYDPDTGLAILATQAEKQGRVGPTTRIEFRVSSDLVRWSKDPLTFLDESALKFSVRYPSLIETSEKDGASHLWLFYSHGPGDHPSWSKTTFMARAIRLMP